MIITKMALPRRTFFRGLGATVALPLLDAMVPALSALARTVAKPVRRLGAVYIPNGANMAGWTPSEVGEIADLPLTLAPLAPFRDQLVVPTNLEIQTGHTTGNHALANACFLSAAVAKQTEGTDYRLATTIDQIAAKEICKDTPLPSLELALDFNYLVGNCDNNFNCVYMNTLAWSSPTTPLPTEANPRVVFERLFGDGGSAAERRRQLGNDRSILDSITEDMARLQRHIGPGDRSKVGEYLDTIREVERRIQGAERQGAQSLPDVLERPVGVPELWEEHAKLMFDLQLLAFQADITRVITFQLARETSARSYPNIGVADSHHPTSHHQDNPEKLANLIKINTYHMSLFAYFLEKMKATSEGDGSLLDHTTYLYGGGLADGNLHDHRNLPLVVVGGGAAGSYKGGRHIRYHELTPMANLSLALLDKVGVHLDSFGDSNGRVGGLLEPLTL